MKDGFIKVAASTVKVGVADIKSNIAYKTECCICQIVSKPRLISLVWRFS